MAKRLQFDIPVDLTTDSTQSEKEKLISQAIIEHQGAFRAFLERSICKEDARTNIVDDSLEIDEIGIDGNEGWASITFMADFYAGCKIWTQRTIMTS